MKQTVRLLEQFCHDLAAEVGQAKVTAFEAACEPKLDYRSVVRMWFFARSSVELG